MARINIDDSIDSDFRFILLQKQVGCYFKAIGILVAFWRIAQRHWVKDDLIPKREFELLNFPELVSSGLAEIREDGVYAVGSDKHFGWLKQKKTAGKAGADKRWHRHGTAIADDSGTIADDSGSWPLTLTPTLSLTQRDIKNISTSKPDAGLVPAGTECSPFDLDIAKQWADHARSVSKTVRPKIPLWAKTVHDLRILDGWSEKNIRSILEQVKTDSFWQKNGASLPNIRKRSENGLTKAENIFSSFEKRKMDKQTHSVSKSNIYQREKLEYVPAIRDTPRQVVSNKPEFVPAIRDKPNEN